jgi:hypothetical protein
MRRFNYDENEDSREEVDNFFNGDGDLNGNDFGDFDDFIDDDEIMQELQYEILSREANNRLLKTTIRMCEKSFWWRFYSVDKKIEHIEKVYNKLRKLEEE